MNPPEIERLAANGISLTVMPGNGAQELCLTAPAAPGASWPELAGRAARLLRDRNAVPVKADIFGPLPLAAAAADALKKEFSPALFPATVIASGAGAGGLQLHAVAGTPVRTICLGSAPAACVYGDADAEYCYIGGVLPPDPRAPGGAQALAALERIEAALAAADMRLSDLARTWFYFADILPWYAEFNSVRSRFFEEKSISAAAAPASTGVSGGNAAGAALAASALAIKRKLPGAAFAPLASPLQCPAPAYGSAFSRAVEVRAAALNKLYISGTASIDAAGNTVHAGDTRAQIARTLEVVKAILASRGMEAGHITRAIAYFRNAGDIARFSGLLRELAPGPLPLLTVESFICRDELLFELEADAAAGV